MITIYFTDNRLTFAPEQYTPSADECILSESEVTSANLDNLFDFCNKIVVPTNDYRGAADRFATRFVYIEAAGGIVENSNGEILLIFRRGRWDLPKGHIDAGEEALQAAIREIEHSATTPQTEEDITAAMWVDKTKLTECMTNSYPTIREIVYKYEHRS